MRRIKVAKSRDLWGLQAPIFIEDVSLTRHGPSCAAECKLASAVGVSQIDSD
jgi:hypothetical protein